MRRLALVALILPACSSGSSDGPPAQEPIPAEFQAIHAEMTAAIDAFQGEVDAAGPGGTLTFGAQLFTANHHRGEGLLSLSAFQGSVLLLDSYRTLGVQGVTLAIGYPLLMPDFPRSAEYLDFYKAIAAEVRKRGMVLNVECGLLFSSGGFTTLPIAEYYAGKSWNEYVIGRAYCAATAAAALAPDHLAVGAEPDVEAILTGQPTDDPDYAEALYAYIVKKVKEAAPAAAVGPGVATWLPDVLDFVDRYLAIPGMDLLDIHVYPVHGSALPRLLEVAKKARNAGKRVIITEAWAYKDVGAVGGAATWTGVMARDLYTCWGPLDRRFLKALMSASAVAGIEYVAPFWTKYFFDGLDYAATRGMSDENRALLLDQRVAETILWNAMNPGQERFTATGLRYRDLAAIYGAP